MFRLADALSTSARQTSGILAQYTASNQVILLLVAAGLVSRLTLLSVSLDEVDSGNFHNALKYGYDIGALRPHAPGYPIYIFMGWLVNAVLDHPLRSLTLLSALLGSLAVIPFYLLLRELAGTKLALVGSLLFIVNPLFWSFSEAALADVPSMFFVLLAAWLAYVGKQSRAAFLWACVVISLAIGVRQANISLLVLLASPVVYRFLGVKEITATAHKLARIIYAMLRYGQQYVDDGADYYEAQYHQRALRSAKRRAAQLGYELVPTSDDRNRALDLPLATAATGA